MPMIDPVTDVTLDDVEYPERESYNGYTYAFASVDNASRFRADPARYADPAKAIDNKEE